MAVEASVVEAEKKSIIHGDCPCLLRRGQMAGVLEQRGAALELCFQDEFESLAARILLIL